MIVYHGSDVRFRRPNYERLRGNDQHGPGLYVTDIPATAAAYGEFIYEYDADMTRMVPSNRRIPNKVIRQLWEDAPTTARELFILNFGYDVQAAYNSLIDPDDNLETLQRIWADAYNFNNSAWLKAIRKHYDGALQYTYENSNYNVHGKACVIPTKVWTIYRLGCLRLRRVINRDSGIIDDIMLKILD